MEVGKKGKVHVEDIVFLIRKDPKKYARVKVRNCSVIADLFIHFLIYRSLLLLHCTFLCFKDWSDKCIISHLWIYKRNKLKSNLLFFKILNCSSFICLYFRICWLWMKNSRKQGRLLMLKVMGKWCKLYRDILRNLTETAS